MIETAFGLTLAEVAAVASIVGVVVSMFKPVRVAAKNTWRKTLGKRGAQLDRIEKELRPNGGESLRDAIDVIKLKIDEMEASAVAALNIHDEAIFRADAYGKVTFTNRAHQRLTGFSPWESKGDGWINYVAPEDRERIHSIWEQAIREQRELNEDITFIHPNGHKYKVRAHVYREVDESNQVLGYLGVIWPLDETGCPHRGKCIEDLRRYMEMK